jgi:hypothetical protein
MSQIQTPIAPGELIDKITILEIKSERISDPAKLENVRRELALLNQVWESSPEHATDVSDARSRLKAVNEALWEIEDDIRERESRGDFGPRFIELARSVYLTNDRRAAIKREINERLGSQIMEEKSYTDYTRKG